MCAACKCPWMFVVCVHAHVCVSMCVHACKCMRSCGCAFNPLLYMSLLLNLSVTACLAVGCSSLVWRKLRESKLKEEWTSSRQSRQQEHRDHTWSTPAWVTAWSHSMSPSHLLYLFALTIDSMRIRPTNSLLYVVRATTLTKPTWGTATSSLKMNTIAKQDIQYGSKREQLIFVQPSVPWSSFVNTCNNEVQHFARHGLHQVCLTRPSRLRPWRLPHHQCILGWSSNPD